MKRILQYKFVFLSVLFAPIFQAIAGYAYVTGTFTNKTSETIKVTTSATSWYTSFDCSKTGLSSINIDSNGNATMQTYSNASAGNIPAGKCVYHFTGVSTGHKYEDITVGVNYGEDGNEPCDRLFVQQGTTGISHSCTNTDYVTLKGHLGLKASYEASIY